MLAQVASILLAGLLLSGSGVSASESVSVRLLDDQGKPTTIIETPAIERTKSEWQARLTKEQYVITRTEGTERAFCGIFHDNHRHGVYACIGCGLPLFRSDAKFDSGTGWPSFIEPFAKENIGTQKDHRYGMERTEIHCVRCRSHLGHVFNDGPPPTGLRYCINSAALAFFENGEAKSEQLYLRKSATENADLANRKGVLKAEMRRLPGTGASEWLVIEIAPSQFSFPTFIKTISQRSPTETPLLLFTTLRQEAAIRREKNDLPIDFAPAKK